MKKPGLLAIISLFTFIACSDVDEQNAAFVTKLGNDTLAVEKFENNGNRFTAQVILRSPATTFTSYDLVLDETGGIESMKTTRHKLEDGFSGNGEVIQTIQKLGDSLKVETSQNGDMRSVMIANESGSLPFIDMVHWPYELAFKSAVASGADSVDQKLLSGSRFSNFVIAAIEGDSMTVRHPSRGVMGVHVNSTGNLVFLDAGLTTRKLKVYREPYSSVDIEQIGKHFASSDRSGNPFGELSGAETGEFAIGGTAFRVEYGSPKRRGRDLFGGIVPWGERWRTGANRATHFYTSSDLVMGGLEVPAGEYTIFTIPEPDGGTMIINKQTGQNGRSYDESRDLGRIPMTISSKAESTEDFTITVEEAGDGGALNLIWGNTVFSVPFEIE